MAPDRGKLFDRLRRRWITAFPEERIRQAIIAWMLDFGDYPKSLLCSEKQLAHFEEMGFDQQAVKASPRAPLRRFDLLSLMRSESGFKPLLLVECKAARLTEKAQKQALDYNYHIKAPFVALACGDECAFTVLVGNQHSSAPKWQVGLPTHAALVSWLKAFGHV